MRWRKGAAAAAAWGVITGCIVSTYPKTLKTSQIRIFYPAFRVVPVERARRGLEDFPFHLVNKLDAAEPHVERAI